jgi:hypothetical protein
LGKFVNFHSIFAFANYCGSFFISPPAPNNNKPGKRRIDLFTNAKIICRKRNQSRSDVVVT